MNHNEFSQLSSEEGGRNEYLAKKENKEKEIQRQAGRAKIAKRIRRLALAAVVVIVVWAVARFTARDDSQPQHTGEYFPAQSRDHIEVGAEHPAYSTNPPTGGWHYANPAKTGIYDIELPDEQLIHNLEHSHIWFAYHPNLPADQIEVLTAIAKDYGSRVIMTPRTANDRPLAIVAWEHLLKMDTVNKEVIDSFVKTHRNKAGPEKNIPDLDFKDRRSSK